MIVSLAIAMTTAQVTQPTRRLEKSENTARAEVTFQTEAEYESFTSLAVDESEDSPQEFRIDGSWADPRVTRLDRGRNAAQPAEAAATESK